MSVLPVGYSYFASVDSGFGGKNSSNGHHMLVCASCVALVPSHCTANHDAWHVWLLKALPGHPQPPEMLIT